MEQYCASDRAAGAVYVFIAARASLNGGVRFERQQWFGPTDTEAEWRTPCYSGEQARSAEVRWFVAWGPKLGHFKYADTLEELAEKLLSVSDHDRILFSSAMGKSTDTVGLG